MASRDSARATETGSGLLLSRQRISTGDSLRIDRPQHAPPVWPAILTSFLHSVSLGAAMLTWLEVCRAVTNPSEESSMAQTYYGRLLAMNGICELVTSQLVGVVSDKFGRRPAQVSAQLGQVVDYLTAGLCLPSLGFLGQVHPTSAKVILFASRGVAGLCGNYKVSLQSYTADISGAEECPQRMAYLGAAMVVGMGMGSFVVAAVSSVQLSFRASFYVATTLNAAIIILVIVKWRDVAPRRNFAWAEANPIAGLHILLTNEAMVVYATLIFLSCFALNMFTSTLDFYCSNFLKMSKPSFIALGTLWALESALCLGFLQPFLTRKFSEIATLQVAFASMGLFYLLFSFLTPSTSGLAFVVIILFSVGSIAYPMAVGLATRELSPEEQGSLQGAVSILETLSKIFAPLVASDVIIPRFDQPGQYFGMVYLAAALLVTPGLLFCQRLYKLTGRLETDREVLVEMH
ncbi:unnamed protein product [Effrenium voratum]|nr:unnamed protein product [Effrenium voratum]|mmetsp:Transcript_49161/g.117204  ORF Transcript_49161/g.117204 Transcript_49161/m.117204 type:complete len:462 (+) Transcript_49161:59-1444(+)